MVLLSSILISIYVFSILMMIAGWWNTSKLENKGLNIRLSVVVPVRNEAENIRNLLEDLFYQSISHDDFEVIVINDHSEDETAEIVEAFIKEHPELNLQIHKNTGSGKKRAIWEGKTRATSLNIITVDGDCRVGPNWLKNYQRAFSHEDVKMVCGPVSFQESRSILGRLQSLEFAGIIGMGAACLKYNMPSMCNGANLGFRKYAFDEVDGYANNMEIPSGDDEFLMHKIHSEYPGSICFLKNRESIVYTSPQENLEDFIHQRRRWASKWSYYEITSPKLMAVFVFMIYLSILVTGILSIFGLFPWQIFLIQILAKLLVDSIYLGTMMRFFEKRLDPLVFFLMELIYPFYVVIFGILSNMGSYKWKGRKFT